MNPGLHFVSRKLSKGGRIYRRVELVGEQSWQPYGDLISLPSLDLSKDATGINILNCRH